MLHIDNDTVARVLRLPDAVKALHDGYRDYANGLSALVPRVDLWAPSEREDGYYCLGTMAGTSARAGVTALRIKSDVIYWPMGQTQEKYAKNPGLYCGFILVFDNATGAPLALINDGVLQHIRVGAAAGVAVKELSDPNVKTLGLLGSGGMADTMMSAILSVRSFEEVSVYSPTRQHRDKFVATVRKRFPNVSFRAHDSAPAAIAKAHVVVSATDSMVPTFDPANTQENALVVTVSRREVANEHLSKFKNILQLGRHTFPPHDEVTEMVYPQSGMAGFVAGSTEQKRRLPWQLGVISQNYPTLIERMANGESTRPLQGRTLVMNTGTQGIQFATIAAHVLRAVEAEALGTSVDEGMFLQDIRD